MKFFSGGKTERCSIHGSVSEPGRFYCNKYRD